MSQFELNDCGVSPVLILGIDPGTTGTKIAFRKAYEVNDGHKVEFTVDSADRIHMLSGYPGYRQTNVCTLPTCMIYGDSGQLFKWGHEAINFQERYAVDPEQVITNWKLRLLESAQQGLLETASERLGKSRGSFVSDFFGAVANYLFIEPKSCLLSHFGINGNIMTQFKFIDVAIAMPPGWSHQEHSIFSNAAKKALAAIPNVRVITVSETECALRSWMTQEGKGLHMVDKEVVILLDLGGGTACLSAFYFAGENQTWVHLESYSLTAGSELVTARFEEDFLKLFRETGLQDMTKALHKARQAFDSIKMGVGEDDEPEFWDCPVDGLVRNGKNFRDGKMRFASEQLRSYFGPSQNEILTKLENMITSLGQAGMKPKYCVLAGAYARNVLFLKRFHEANDTHMKMQVFQPQYLAELVATGACLARIEGDCRLASGSRISVGIMTFMKWSKVKRKCPDAHRFPLEGEGRTLWCRVITWVIKKGENADPDKAIIDHDGENLRKRRVEMQDSIIFNETIFTSEAHPGKDRYTVLMYSTDDSGQRNRKHFKERHGFALNIHEFTLDLTDKPIIQKDGSAVAMKNSLFKRNHDGKYFEYKYYMNISQTDCRMSLEAFSATGKTRRMLLQYSIAAFEVESAELQDEHRFVEQHSPGARAQKGQPQSPNTGPDGVRTRSPLLENAGHRPSPSNFRSLQTSENYSRPVIGLPFGAVTDTSFYQQSRQDGLSNPAMLSNTQQLTESRRGYPSRDSFTPINSVPSSQIDSSNVAMAAKAFNFALAAKTGLQEEHHKADKSFPATQRTPIRRRPKGKDWMHVESGVSSGVIFPSDPRTTRKRATDLENPITDSEDSDYQPTKRYAKKHSTPSVKDPVMKQTRSSWRFRKVSRILPKQSNLDIMEDLL